MITVSIQIMLPRFPGGGRNLALGDGCTVGEMLARLGIEISRPANLLVVVNGKSCLPDDCLGDGDKVVILPMLCGG